VIYLLHFDEPIGKARHYLGTCGDSRITRRMRQHAMGNGAALTREAARRNITMYLARVFPDLHHETEKRMKAQGRYKDLCPLCCPMFEHLKSDVHAINSGQVSEAPMRAVWDVRPLIDIRDN